MSMVAIVTGGSSGIGLCTARALKARGITVYELSRRDAAPGDIIHISADITDEAQVAAAVAEIMQREGRIDILINNAGMGISGAMEFTPNEESHRLMEVNVFGMVNMCKAVIPHMRARGGGRIVNLSSVAGPLAIPFQMWYSMSKAAVSSFTLALANELRPFNIRVCAVLPGDIKTGFTAARRKNSVGDDIYGGRIERSVAVMEKDEQNGMSPEVAGKFICRTALKKGRKPIFVIGPKYKLFVFLAGILPAGLCNRIVGMIYAK